MRGFDNLIHGKPSDNNPTGGGLPLSSPGITTIAGGPGSGKSTFCYNAAALNLHRLKLSEGTEGSPILWFTLEKPISEVAWNIRNIAEKLDLDLGIEERNGDEYVIPNFECYDFYSTGVTPRTIPNISRIIIDWQRKTKGKIIIIDSITELTAYEMHLREALKRFLVDISREFVDNKILVAIVWVSQYRGAGRDEGIAGGMAVGHRSNAVVQIESTYVSNFDKKYYGMERGQQVRKIWVEKTASFAHETSEFLYTISKDGIVVVDSKPLSKSYEGSCVYCPNPINLTDDYVVLTIENERKYSHKTCFLGRQPTEKPSKASASPLGI